MKSAQTDRSRINIVFITFDLQSWSMSIPGYKENYAYTSGDSRTNLIPKTCLHLLCFTTVSGKLYLHCKGERVNSLPKLLQHKICHFQSTTPGAQTHPETKLLHFFFVHTPNKIHFLFFLQVVICNNSSFLHIQKPSLLTPQIQTLKPSFARVLAWNAHRDSKHLEQDSFLFTRAQNHFHIPEMCFAEMFFQPQPANYTFQEVLSTALENTDIHRHGCPLSCMIGLPHRHCFSYDITHSSTSHKEWWTQ